jgi:prevent-host-death family protein
VKVVNIHEAKTNLSRLVQEALDGEEIIIARGNEPVVRLVVVDSARRERVTGWAKGLVRISDDFDAPLDDFNEYR